MSQPFPHLFSPLEIRGVEIRNRVFSTGHDTNMAEDGLPGDTLIAYQRARARGGGPTVRRPESGSVLARAVARGVPSRRVSSFNCQSEFNTTQRFMHMRLLKNEFSTDF